MRWKLAARLTAVVLAMTVSAQAQDKMPEMHQMPGKKAMPSTTLTVSVDGKSTTYTFDQLNHMPQHNLKLTNGHTLLPETYTGVSVADLLAKSGLSLENGGASRVYHSYVRAEGTDHYTVIFSAGELEPGLRETDSIIALSLEGKPLGDDGAFRIIVGGEKKPARWVRNLVSLTVITLP